MPPLDRTNDLDSVGALRTAITQHKAPTRDP
jgi:hypothetical protein